MNKEEQEMIKIITKTTKESAEVVSNALKSINARVVEYMKKQQEDSNKSALEFIDRLAYSWKDMTKEEQQEVSKTIAGRHQMGRFMVLLEGLSQRREKVDTEKAIAIYNNLLDDLWIKQDKDKRLWITVESYTPSFNLSQKEVNTSDVKQMLIDYRDVLNRFIEDMNKLPED